MTEGIDNMILRMDDNIKYTESVKHEFMNLKDFNELVYSKTGIVQYFFEMEDNLKEYMQFIKTLARGYIESQEQVLDLNQRLDLSEYKLRTTEETMFGLREDIKDLVEQLRSLEEKQFNNTSYINELETNLTLAENRLRNKNEEIAQLHSDSLEYRSRGSIVERCASPGVGYEHHDDIYNEDMPRNFNYSNYKSTSGGYNYDRTNNFANISNYAKYNDLSRSYTNKNTNNFDNSNNYSKNETFNGDIERDLLGKRTKSILKKRNLDTDNTYDNTNNSKSMSYLQRNDDNYNYPTFNQQHADNSQENKPQYRSSETGYNQGIGKDSYKAAGYVARDGVLDPRDNKYTPENIPGVKYSGLQQDKATFEYSSGANVSGLPYDNLQHNPGVKSSNLQRENQHSENIQGLKSSGLKYENPFSENIPGSKSQVYSQYEKPNSGHIIGSNSSGFENTKANQKHRENLQASNLYCDKTNPEQTQGVKSSGAHYEKIGSEFVPSRKPSGLLYDKYNSEHSPNKNEDLLKQQYSERTSNSNRGVANNNNNSDRLGRIISKNNSERDLLNDNNNKLKNNKTSLKADNEETYNLKTISKQQTLNADSKSSKQLNEKQINPKKSSQRNLAEHNQEQANEGNPNVSYQKQKVQRISDIILKMETNAPVNTILKKIFGDDIIDKITAPDGEELLNEIEETVKGIEKVIEKDANALADEIPEVKEEHEEEQILDNEVRAVMPRRSLVRNISPNQCQRRSTSRLRRSRSPSGPYEFNNTFESSLRKQETSPVVQKAFKRPNPYGNFFDPGLMSGGKSVLEEKDKKIMGTLKKRYASPTMSAMNRTTPKYYPINIS
jgi:hypothetical protein